MTRYNHWIQLPELGRRSPEWIQENPEKWQRLLQGLHDAKTWASCCCRGTGDRNLIPVHLGDSYFLRREPHHGPDHDPECSFWAVDPRKSGLGGYSEGVVTEREDGRKAVRLTIGIQKAKTNLGQLPAPPEDGPRKPGSRKTAMTPLGLLSLLWEDARLNIWHPKMEGKRVGTAMEFSLKTAAEGILVGRKSLHEFLAILAPNDSMKHLEPCRRRNWAAINLAKKDKQRVAVIGEVDHEGLLATGPLSFTHQGFHRTMGIFPPAVANALRRAIAGHLRAILALGGTRPRVMVLAMAEPEWGAGCSRLMVVAAGAMLMTAEYLPVESSHEWRLAEDLTRAGRHFVKPLRYDSESSQVLPDFVLTDTTPREFPMEVYGMATEAYEARREEKEAFYRETYGEGRYWLWDAGRGLPIPPLPPQIQREPQDREEMPGSTGKMAAANEEE